MILCLLLVSITGYGEDRVYKRYSRKFSPTDYLFGERDTQDSKLFDDLASANLTADLGIGTDCGRISIKNTLKATLQNLLDSKYFEKLGTDILAASPMLLTCYYSPSWCSILKNFRLKANMLARLRLNQCSLISKYTDSRVEDFYAERQECAHKAIDKHGGDMEKAMEECSTSKMWDFDLQDWSGSGSKVGENRLLESAAKWTGLSGEEGRKTLDLVKSLVGDYVVAKGKVSVDWGPQKLRLTPRIYYKKVQKETFQTLCEGLIKELSKNGLNQSFSKKVTDEDLKRVSGADQKTEVLIDRQTIRSLVAMPYFKRRIACKQLSGAMALTKFTRDMGKSIDALFKMSEDVHLPEKRKRQIRTKMNKLKNNVKFTLDLKKAQNTPLNEVQKRINEQGMKYIDQSTKKQLKKDSRDFSTQDLERSFFDCADEHFCEDN